MYDDDNIMQYKVGMGVFLQTCNVPQLKIYTELVIMQFYMHEELLCAVENVISMYCAFGIWNMWIAQISDLNNSV